VTSGFARIKGALSRAQHRMRRLRRSPKQIVATTAVCVIAGFMIAASSIAARGTDLRPSRNNDLIDLVVAQATQNQEKTKQLADLRSDVAELQSRLGGDDGLRDELARAAADAGLTAVSGPAVSVTLSDAPAEVNPPGVDGDLVVHQQDIQAVVNALWRGGAEAMTIQGVRVTSRTGVKCVGNTIVLHGVPYAPPYRIVAIGSQLSLNKALDESPAIIIYKEYVTAYRLGWVQENLSDVTLPAHEGVIENRYARKP
jgi:uncharacterized protein YlxW (UPF0749 family)